ncbi:MAG TPA: PilZ domain-containing protein [Allosphingosinicella sp.]|nr:PilZ domain-containing protein [Allosphingosinicella sp.]
MGAEQAARTVLAVKRARKRARLQLQGVLLGATGETEVRLRDLSCSGALGETAKPPAEGSEVVLASHGMVVPAKIAWVIGRRFGLDFQHPISAEDVALLSGARRSG